MKSCFVDRNRQRRPNHIALFVLLATAELITFPSVFVAGFAAASFPHSRLQNQPHSASFESSGKSSGTLIPRERRSFLSRLKMSSATTANQVTNVPSWSDLTAQSAKTPAGKAMNQEVKLREQGQGSPSRENTLRKFDAKDGNQMPAITLYRDHAAWCPYCQKTMLLVEEKQIPIQIELVNMRSYGDKSREYLQKVPGGLLPAIEVKGQVITESQIIMELLDQWFSESDGYRSMMPSSPENQQKYKRLLSLERELFGNWCSVVFRPEGNILSGIFGGDSSSDDMSPALKSFMACMREVDSYLLSTKGPWFLDEQTDHPTMIDLIFVSHVERMLASLAYWKGIDLRDVSKWNFRGLVNWLEAFEQREAYLAFKSDYYTHVMDIPPQYGPGYDGGLAQDRQKFQEAITGRDGKSWHLPLSHDDPLQPLYKGLPLPQCVLQAYDIEPDTGSLSYEKANPEAMAEACRSMAGWKLAQNGANVAKFAARGGPNGSQNPRKTFAAPLADPYANPDEEIQPMVDAILRVVCAALLDVTTNSDSFGLPASKHQEVLHSTLGSASSKSRQGVVSSLEYLRDRVGVPRDLPLAAARYLRAYLNWAIDSIEAKA